ncbi:Protein N-acetyltransferase, RimJ/RimL family [Pseudovibrio ascidiaceicola]|uniref:Protein N-acetyltransferase, RimJ/RimL family n=1 Tax=Pseudovibrio ascidiaceicola TaxID=285279 RepID=A0A1I3ZTA2_9HYPH|nr:GNAT family N-acetyltransferase [Pseudovibrio ascidiaceicola]SFK47325.1 Protein N-acetyltransferase, RimJ/RimL family [Pseudovibrio ascidiaceicola]
MLPKARLVDPLSIPVPEQVLTNRLQILKPALDVAAQLTEARTESFNDLLPWFHEVMGDRDQEASQSWQTDQLAEQIRSFELRERLPFYIFSEDKFIGYIELLPIWRRGQFRLTYWIRSQWARRGYGSEAVSAMVIVAFDALFARLVTTGHAEPNEGSARLARNLRFKEYARTPLACELPDGSLVSGVAYVLQRADHLRIPEVRWS